MGDAGVFGSGLGPRIASTLVLSSPLSVASSRLFFSASKSVTRSLHCSSISLRES